MHTNDTTVITIGIITFVSNRDVTTTIIAIADMSGRTDVTQEDMNIDVNIKHTAISVEKIRIIVLRNIAINTVINDEIIDKNNVVITINDVTKSDDQTIVVDINQ